MTRNDYTTKMDEYIEKEFTELKTDPTHKFQTNLIKTLKESPTIITPSEIYHLKNLNPQPPILYGLPKIHKTNIPMRPIVSYCQAPFYKLCQKLAHTLPKL